MKLLNFIVYLLARIGAVVPFFPYDWRMYRTAGNFRETGFNVCRVPFYCVPGKREYYVALHVWYAAIEFYVIVPDRKSVQPAAK